MATNNTNGGVNQADIRATMQKAAPLDPIWDNPNPGRKEKLAVGVVAVVARHYEAGDELALEYLAKAATLSPDSALAKLLAAAPNDADLGQLAILAIQLSQGTAPTAGSSQPADSGRPRFGRRTSSGSSGNSSSSSPRPPRQR